MTYGVINKWALTESLCGAGVEGTVSESHIIALISVIHRFR